DLLGRKHSLVTWGRAFDPVDPKPLLHAVGLALSQFGLPAIRTLKICSTLQEASSQPYFFEALLAFSQYRIPSGKRRSAWNAARRKQIISGKDIYYLGKPVT